MVEVVIPAFAEKIEAKALSRGLNAFIASSPPLYGIAAVFV
jgi:hypothetical protein